MRFLFINNQPCIAYGIAPGLQQAGHYVDVIPLWTVPYNEQQDVLFQHINRFKPDFIFAEGEPPNLNWYAIYEARNFFSIPLVYWAIEDPLWFKEISLSRGQQADFIFTTTIELISEYQKLGLRAGLLLFACDSAIYRRVAPSPGLAHDIVLVGSNYEPREAAARYMLEPLMRAGFDLKVWGNWWTDRTKPFHIPEKYYGGKLPYQMLPQVYSSARIVLGLHLDDRSVTQTSVRTFEAMSCGAFYLTQYTRAHANMFKRGIHLEWAQDERELLEMVRFYLANDQERQRIALAGQDYVYKYHTVLQRAGSLVKQLSAI